MVSEHRVVWEIAVDADDPLQAALKMRDLWEDHQHCPVLTVYTDHYKTVYTVDLGKPASEAVTVVTPPVVGTQLDERDY